MPRTLRNRLALLVSRVASTLAATLAVASAAAVLAATAAAPAHAWGPLGHRITAEIASRHLSDPAKAEVKALLGVETLAQVSNWPDFIKSDPAWDAYKPWHYVNIPPGKSYAKAKKALEGDLVRALLHFENVLRDPKAAKEDRVTALKFYVHLMGDLHQPLHTGKAEDQGGNAVKLTWFGEKSNLHRLWDEHLIEMQQLSFTEYTAFIDHPTKAQLREWQATDYLAWVEESQALVQPLYSGIKGKYWEYAYNYRHLATLNEQLLKGGIRLAGMLNRVFEDQPLSEREKKLRELIPAAPKVKVKGKPKTGS